MVSQLRWVFTKTFVSVSRWFTSVMDATGAGEFYLAAVFVALTCTFLLSNFGAAFRIGSDKAAKRFSRKGDV